MDIMLLSSFLPEIFLSFSILFQLFLNACLINNINYNFPILNKEIFFQCIFILLCVLLLILNNQVEGYFTNFIFLNDTSTKLIKILILVICIIVLLPLIRGFELQKLNFFEYFSVFLIAVLSSLLLVNVCDMLSAYLVIEMQALSFYVLASFKRNSSFSTEAAIKYFILGSSISGVYLLGSSLIYGILGTLNFNHLSLLLSFPIFEKSIAAYNFLLVGLLLVTIVFLFKTLAAPFQFWAPDIYEGSPLSSTIVFSIIAKFSIFYIFIKWILITNLFNEIKILLIVSGILSIFFGSFFALNQRRMKRLVINSSNAQTGFLIAVLASNSLNGYASLIYFLIIYLITSILIWSNISLFLSFQNKLTSFFKKQPFPLYISSVSSFFKTNKLWAFSNIIIFFSLAGVPPFAGFFAKIMVLLSIIESNNLIVSFILLIISAISVFYYIRIIKIIFFEKSTSHNVKYAQVVFKDYFFDSDCLVIAFLLFLLMFLFFYPSFFLLLSNLIILTSYFF